MVDPQYDCEDMNYAHLDQLWADEMNGKVKSGTYREALRRHYEGCGLTIEQADTLKKRIRELEAHVSFRDDQIVALKKDHCGAVALAFEQKSEANNLKAEVERLKLEALENGAEIAALTAEKRELREALRNLEWSAGLRAVPIKNGFLSAGVCPTCLSDSDTGHDADCRLGLLLETNK